MNCQTMNYYDEDDNDSDDDYDDYYYSYSLLMLVDCRSFFIWTMALMNCDLFIHVALLLCVYFK